MKLSKTVNSTIATLVLGVSSSAWAHPGHSSTAPTFFDGLVHPFTGLDHLALLAAGGAMLAVVQHRMALSRWWLLGLAGIFASGAAAMMGNVPIALLGFAMALACMTFAAMRTADRHGTFIALGTTAAISLQAGSHVLAWGDVSPHIDFAIGFGLASLGVFSAAYAIAAAALTKSTSGRLV